MKALIFTTNNNQIVQVKSQEFPTAPSLVWVNCPDDCTTEWSYIGKKFTSPAGPSKDEQVQNKIAEIDQLEAQQFMSRGEREAWLAIVELQAEAQGASLEDAYQNNHFYKKLKDADDLASKKRKELRELK